MHHLSTVSFRFVLVSDCIGRSVTSLDQSRLAQTTAERFYRMSDTEEDSLSSESWPINEDWLIEVLKKHHEVRSGIKITVSFQAIVALQQCVSFSGSF